MNSLEKAQELVEKFYQKQCEILNKNWTVAIDEVEMEIAKASAIIAVEEITQYLTKVDHDYNISEYINFWNSVKTEINAL